ncbi:hypothetical protein Tco_0259714 [Tanacetum coccineum]
MIAYALCWGLNIDIAGILFNDLVLKLSSSGKKGRENNVCYIRYLSLVIEHLLGEDYLNDNLKLIKPFQITDATFKPFQISEVPLTSHMRKVAKLTEKPLILPFEEVNAEDSDDKSLSETVVHLVSKPKAKTDKKRMTKKILSSSEPNVSQNVRILTLNTQASKSQPAEETKVTADNTQSLDTSKSAEEKDNQPQTADAESPIIPIFSVHSESAPDNDTLEAKHVVDEQHDDDEFVDSGLQSIGDVSLETLNEHVDECPYDTESEIKFVKRFKPMVNDDEPLIRSMKPGMEEDSDMALMPDDDVGSLSGSHTSENTNADRAIDE